jgi:hypothetical protein
MIKLFVNVYRDGHPDRRKEIEDAFRRNLDNPCIDKIFAIGEQSDVTEEYHSSKVTNVPLAGRPTFQQYFDIVSQHSTSTDINIIANSDIYFDDSLTRLNSIDLLGRCIALLRWEVEADGTASLCQWNGAVMSNSQDTWIFRGCPRLKQPASFMLGMPGCDNRVARILIDSGYELINPAFDLKSYHLHRSGIRRISPNTGCVPGPHSHVPPCTWREALSSTPIIAISLFGDNPDYTQGAITNIELAERFYPGWLCRFYVDQTVPESCRKILSHRSEVIMMPHQKYHLQGMFWRYLVADAMAPRWIVRDADSRIGEREVAAVEEWILSRKPFHVMRDHPGHARPIMGGMFGGVRGAVPEMTGLVANWPHHGRLGNYGDDEDFLTAQVWPLVRAQAIQHDTFNSGNFGPSSLFPTSLTASDYHFVGEKFDATGTADAESRAEIMRVIGGKAR